MKQGDRVKMTTVKIHEDGMPFVTRYGTLVEVSSIAFADEPWHKVEWDNGETTQGFAPIQGVMPIGAKMRYPEPIAYINPGPPRYIGNDRIDEFSSSKEEYDRKALEAREAKEDTTIRPR